MSITGVVLTHNNQDDVAVCLDGLSWCDEVVVIDDNSTDKTVKIAKDKGTTVYIHDLNGDWAAQRNFALQKVHMDWILFVDSDEIVTKELQTEIQHKIKENVNGYYIKRQDIFLEQILKHGETSEVRLLRLARKNAGKWRRAVHEVWEIDGKKDTLQNPLLHNRKLTVSEFISRLNTYTDIDAKELVKENKNFSLIELGKPIAKFGYFYIFKLGFLDGVPGLFMAILMSIHSLVVRIKTWEIKRN